MRLFPLAKSRDLCFNHSLGAVRVTLFCSLLITELEEQIALCDAEFTCELRL